MTGKEFQEAMDKVEDRNCLDELYDLFKLMDVAVSEMSKKGCSDKSIRSVINLTLAATFNSVKNDLVKGL